LDCVYGILVIGKAFSKFTISIVLEDNWEFIQNGLTYHATIGPQSSKKVAFPAEASEDMLF